MIKSIAIRLSFVVVVGLGAFMFHNCAGQQIKHQKFPPIGQAVVLDDVSQTKPAKADHNYNNVLFYFLMGGRTIFYGEDLTLEMYEKDAEQPIYSFSSADLEASYKTTGCDQDVAKYLENTYEGDALFCNNEIDLSRVHTFVVKRPGKSDKVATSYSYNFAKEDIDLVALTVGF